MANKPSRKLYGVLGYPLAHSLSPLMHNAALRSLRINALYTTFEVPPEGLAGFIAAIPKRNIRGFNVTIPHKERIIPYLQSVSLAARAIGAVNTVTVGDKGGLAGHNTDCLGFMRHMMNLKIKPAHVAMIGAGGAAKAVAFALGKKKAKTVRLYDVDKFKALALMKKFNALFPGTQYTAVGSVSGLGIQTRDLLVNASPIGMKECDPCLVRSDQLCGNIFVYDLIYNPQETALLALARQKGLAYANGLDMLLYQGAASLNYWISPRKAPVEVMRRALEKGVK